MQMDRIWRRARLATCRADAPGLGVVEDGVIATKAGRIAYAGPAANWRGDAPEVIDLDGRWVTPGLIDCHTHLVYAGDRAAEFEQRLAGASYAEIAAAGGGILSTVRATRAASVPDLIAASLPRLDRLLADGVTTLEVKSGYGLEVEAECRMLAAARGLAAHRSVNVVTTFLGAHALPPEMPRADYLGLVTGAMLEAITARGLADHVDVFCEGIAFSLEETRQVFDAARRHGLPVKLHAEQLSNLGGSRLAAAYGALSVDHVEYTDPADAAALAAAGTVAVLLPAAFFCLRETKLPPIAAFRAAGVPMALASDCNPGTAPVTSLLLVMSMAATLFRLTVDEILLGVTRHAAQALGRLDQIGTLEPGKRCDLAIWEVERLAELPYRLGYSPLAARIVAGEPA
ncbi:MAG: imidazolonepropionase [Alphaproteobacteria bacterium]|nr:MAG: imidazolonepropionase [Alphaproteobacteria bacterium]